MVKNPKSNLTFFFTKKSILSFLTIILFFGYPFVKVSSHTLAIDNFEKSYLEIDEIPIAEVTVPIDIVFVGYNEDYIDLATWNNDLQTDIYYLGVDYYYNEEDDTFESLLDLDITLDFNFHFTTESYSSNFDSFIDTNSWDGTTSALNATQLNLQEETGERMSIFYEQNGRAIDGEALEQYLVDNAGYTSTKPSYAIYFLNQSRFDTFDHSFEHWFEIDETDPDSNAIADWWRLEWDNDLNPDVEYPYPCWGYQNRLFFIDPYCHQWYTKWTDIWWNGDYAEGDIDHHTVDLDTYLENDTLGSPDYITNLNEYLIGYLNDIATDVGGRGDGLLYNQREISAQILMINDELHHGYSQEDLEWIYSEDVAEEAFEYVVPNEVATLNLEETWVELSECSDLNGIVTNSIMDSSTLGSYPWYRSDWTYLNGINIFYGFQDIVDNYFNTSKGDTTFTSWILLLQNVSMVAYSYGEYREYTGLGGGGNVVCYKNLNRYFASDGTTPRSGLTTLLVHEIGHVLGFLHAEITNDAEEGTGGFMRDVMSYYSEGTPYFSIFLKDSLYRTSSFVAYYRNKPAIDTYRSDPDHNATFLTEFDEIIVEGEAALEGMEYLDAFLAFRQLYEFNSKLEELTATQDAAFGIDLTMIIILLPAGIFYVYLKKRNRRY